MDDSGNRCEQYDWCGNNYEFGHTEEVDCKEDADTPYDPCAPGGDGNKQYDLEDNKCCTHDWCGDNFEFGCTPAGASQPLVCAQYNPCAPGGDGDKERNESTGKWCPSFDDCGENDGVVLTEP